MRRRSGTKEDKCHSCSHTPFSPAADFSQQWQPKTPSLIMGQAVREWAVSTSWGLPVGQPCFKQGQCTCVSTKTSILCPLHDTSQTQQLTSLLRLDGLLNQMMTLKPNPERVFHYFVQYFVLLAAHKLQWLPPQWPHGEERPRRRCTTYVEGSGICALPVQPQGSGDTGGGGYPCNMLPPWPCWSWKAP